MGMYTGLWGEIKLSDCPMGKAMQVWFEELYCNDDMLGIIESHEYDWVLWFNTALKAILPDGLDGTTAEQITDGISSTHRLWMLMGEGDSYMPWDSKPTTYDPNTKVIRFTSSIKNYGSEIEVFVEWVLPKIAVAWDLLSLYEEDELDDATKHQFNVELLCQS